MLKVNVLRAVRRKMFRSLISSSSPANLWSQSFRMASTLPNLAIFQALTKHEPDSTAVINSASNQAFTYGNLLRDVVATKKQISQTLSGSPLQGERVAFLSENSYEYVVTFLAILAHEAIALPLSHSFPASELRYLLENSEAKLLLSTSKLAAKAQDVLKEGLRHKPVLSITHDVRRTSAATGEDFINVDGATSGVGGFMLYTSGTTSRPKGVILSTSVITAQARSLIEAWNYRKDDLLLHLLPLHHIHGTINALFTPLLAGAAVEFLFPFNASATWKRLAASFLPRSTSDSRRPITFLTAVPTIYNRLLSTHPSLSHEMQEAARAAISPANLRLNISGSAALPTPIKTAWSDLSHGNILLERYGMTEVGMALSCGLDPDDRFDGSVGWPLPSVEVRLVDVETNEIIPEERLNEAGGIQQGEIQLRGPTVFTEYWQNPKATAAEFVSGNDDRGKWFKTGDIALRRTVEGAGKSSQTWARGPMYFIQGRKSVDIIKSGGEKVSALEIERELLSLPQVSEATVVGIPSEQWGQKIAAVIVLEPAQANSGKAGKKWGAMDMRRALKDSLASYKVPHELKIVESMPRNAMGKINKKSLIQEVFGLQHAS